MLFARLVCYTALTLHCLAASGVYAAMPARFDGGVESFAESIVFPEVPGVYVANVYCKAIITPRGRMTRNFCVRSENVDQAFHDAIDKAATAARLVPALVSPAPNRKIFSYRVTFARHEGTAQIRVFPNWVSALAS